MRKSYFTIILLLCFSLFSIPLSAQVKYEKESRVKEKDVPAKALQFIDTLALNKKIKWFKEEGLKANSFEAKFKLDRVRYSIEFDTLGAVEDIEVEKAWKDLNDQLRTVILERLKGDCLKHRIDKVQVQYAGKPSELIAIIALNGKSQNHDVIIQYEIIVKCRQEEEVNLYEYLFSEAGQILSVSKIVFKNSSHLEY